ncbi:MAG TPA: flagellar motor switch protein FliG, partial [Alphaproteobacteria bacterium]|nr:flagellar motor switch protein FliG [Alphaproteobacteria bacterium]
MAVNNNPREEYQSIKGAEKAAILMMTLSEEQASKIFACMDEDEIREISQAMANLGKISSNVMEKLYTEFSTLIAGSGNVVGSYENTERLLTKLLPKDKVTNIMEEIRGPAGRTMWDKLGNVSEEILATYLKNEYPQTISVVLSKIKPEHASKVLGLFPDNLAMEVVLRMLRMESVQKDILDDIERTLKVEFMSNLARASKKDAHQTMADI